MTKLAEKVNTRGEPRRAVDSLGYIRIKLPNHPHASSNGWVREHIVVALDAVGLSELPDEHCVHHINGIKTDNTPENLEIIPVPLHVQGHFNNQTNRRFGESNPLILCACGCGLSFFKFDNRGRARKLIYGHH